MCAELARDGVQPVIAMRGFGADHPGESDEALEYATTAPEARCVVDPDRTRALHAELSRVSPTELARCAVVLDDGFQHRQLARDLDIVLVDATRPSLDGDLLPNGWLREPARNIARAGLVVLTKAGDTAQRARAAELVLRARGRPHDAVCDHAWRGLSVHHGGVARDEPVAFLAGKRVVSVCALGNSAHFHAMVGGVGAQVVSRREKGDHRPFSAAELERAAADAGAEIVVTSLKDFVKLDRAPTVAVAVPSLGISFIEGEDRVRAACVRAQEVDGSQRARRS
jgi:tetraacyldisaccharide 4'-kinase